MNDYIIIGKILPERAIISIVLPEVSFSPIVSEKSINKAKVSINNNQVYILYSTDSEELRIHDIRNIAKQLIADHLSIIGYVLGYAYEIELTRIINIEKGIDYVFGIDIPCLANRLNSQKPETYKAEVNRINNIISKQGSLSIYIYRCLNDLKHAMTNPDDTGFYCYRAIESLKQFCKYKFEIESEKEQWAKLSELTAYDSDKIQFTKEKAGPARHGDLPIITDDDRVRIFTDTWDIVDSFFQGIGNE